MPALAIIPPSSFARALRVSPAGAVIGFRFSGTRSGPTLLVALSDMLFRPVTDRLTRLPTLPWMRGAMDVIHLDAIAQGVWQPDQDTEATLTLPGHVTTGPAIRSSYFAILRQCTRLGMIDGRGVPLR